MEGLGDPRAASLVLRQCLSACKLTRILRTAEPSVALWAADEASPFMRRAWCTIIGDTVPDAHWRLSCLPIRAGGAGLSDPKDIVHSALVSSWVSACTQQGLLACTDPPSGWIDVLGQLATVAPNLGQPLLNAFQASGPSSVRQHQLLPQWCTQGTWADEIVQTLSKNFDENVEERLK